VRDFSASPPAAGRTLCARVHAGLKLDVSERIALFGFFEGEFSDLGEGYAGLGGGDVTFAGQNYAGRVGMRVAW
jgi:hypothetical protein